MKEIKEVFAWDHYGGIVKCTLDYEQDAVFIRDDYQDDYSSIVDFLENNMTFRTLQEAADAYTGNP